MKHFFFLLILCASLAASADVVKRIPQGKFAPLYGIEKDQKNFQVESFFLDVYPVTFSEFESFLKKHPDYRKENIPSIYADNHYLLPVKKVGSTPVVYVSWFAANAYCESKKGRMPTTLEWEYVAASDDIDKILLWYSTPENDDLVKTIGHDTANKYGIHNLHGLNWEWTSDFNSVIMTSDNREDGNKSSNQFCGAGSIGSRTKEDYAGFIRYSLRSSLEATFSLKNLGFRCAYDK